MARNEEKQQGRLNRLWLQRERQEGRLKDTRESRPKLCTLNTAASVKKWIPSIKKEIEYYLQQSQLTHYPERKIAEFLLKIEALEKEYKRFITKLRTLDPLCKHHPWTPRAYSKRRAEQQDSHFPVKKPNATLTEEFTKFFEDRSGETNTFSATLTTQTTVTPTSESKTRTISQVPSHSDTNIAAQDLPLCFDQSRLAVAVAPFRGSSTALCLTQTNSLVKVLQSGLPNLGNCATGDANHQNLTDKNEHQLAEHSKSENSVELESATEKQDSMIALTTGRGHVLGLDCYSSDDEDNES